MEGWSHAQKELWKQSLVLLDQEEEGCATASQSDAYVALVKAEWERLQALPAPSEEDVAGLCRLLRYMARRELFPLDKRLGRSTLFEERLSLLFAIWEQAMTRSLASMAALICLSLDIYERWNEDFSSRRRVIQIDQESPFEVLPANAMLSLYGEPFATKKFEALAHKTPDEKHEVLDELLDFIATYEDRETARVLLEQSLGGLFVADKDTKVALYTHLLTRLKEAWTPTTHLRWQPLVDQLFEQNKRAPEVILFLVELGAALPALVEPYVISHLIYMPPKEVEVTLLRDMGKWGSPALLPQLARIRDMKRGSLSKAQKQAAHDAIEAIVRRRGLDPSATIRADDERPEKQLIAGLQQGPLTLPEGVRVPLERTPTDEAAVIVTTSDEGTWVWVVWGLSVVVILLLLVLAWRAG